ncbi:MAG: tRNA (N6-threonylcarbamoyladenosine(37)-N6)-methyltransferase TrmO [Thermoprotei archaeon]|nr:tRNA (N6-threonylcarbamoyladenosine(37)-N6)-methyltransferase TrmO [Thermoprotei archaeon]
MGVSQGHDGGSMEVRPIGYVLHEGEISKIVVLPEYTDGLRCIDGFSHLIIICWMHEARRDVLMVHPRPKPRLTCGVFATRSPSRPNPLGLYVVTLLKRKNNELYIERIDAYEGTPVVDIKPYIPDLDARTDVKTGWLKDP